MHDKGSHCLILKKNCCRQLSSILRYISRASWCCVGTVGTAWSP